MGQFCIIQPIPQLFVQFLSCKINKNIFFLLYIIINIRSYCLIVSMKEQLD